MKNLRMRLVTIIYLFVFSFLSAQEFNGIATYRTSSKMKMSMDSTKVSTDEQKALNEMIVKSMQKEYELHFNKTESIYKQIESLDINDGTQEIEVIGLGSGTEGGLYKNIKKLDLVENKDLFGKLFLIKDKLEKYDWKLEEETRQIGDYLCYKAVTTFKSVKMIKVINEDGVEVEKEKEIITKISAWYTPEIPISNGPASYWGLPGLILEVDNGRLSMICTKVIINPQDKIKIDKPKKGKVVNTQEYKKIYLDKIKEMQEMYKNKRKKNDD